MTDPPPPFPPDRRATAARAAGPAPADGADVGPWAVDGRGTVWTLGDRGVVVETPGRRPRGIALDDPADTTFEGLPHLDLADGRPLRASAFATWSFHVRTLLAAGAVFETTFRRRRPWTTAFGILGGLLVGSGSLFVTAAFLGAPRRVWREPGAIEWAALLVLVTLLLWVGWSAFSAVVRLWLTRNGSYLRVSRDGLSFAPGEEPRPFATVCAARPRPFARCTELELVDGRRLLVPREAGPLVRPDLLLRALRPEGRFPTDGPGF